MAIFGPQEVCWLYLIVCFWVAQSDQVTTLGKFCSFTKKEMLNAQDVSQQPRYKCSSLGKQCPGFWRQLGPSKGPHSSGLGGSAEPTVAATAGYRKQFLRQQAAGGRQELL